MFQYNFCFYNTIVNMSQYLIDGIYCNGQIVAITKATNEKK